MRARRLPLNLQFFSQEKTEKATPKKKQESRQKGQVAKSSDISSAFTMLFVFLTLLFTGKWMTGHIMQLYEKSFTQYALWELTASNVHVIFTQVVAQAALIVLPTLGIAMLAGLFANYIQVGFLFTTEPLMIKLERLNPIEGAKRIFSLRALVELLKSIFKIILASWVAISVLMSSVDEIFTMSRRSLGDVLHITGSLTLEIGLKISILLIVLAIFDYLYQRYDHEKNLRMSKQDIKDEYKKSEGDPLIKSKIKEKQRQMAMRRMMQDVPKADVIITNPTHYAIAIQYNAGKMDAPTIVAKGTDHLAHKIKEVAKEHDIVLMENKPLARALYHSVEIGEAIPQELFQAVAEVLAYVYKLKGTA